jgi:flagellar basal body-associated protein FliL
MSIDNQTLVLLFGVAALVVSAYCSWMTTKELQAVEQESVDRDENLEKQLDTVEKCSQNKEDFLHDQLDLLADRVIKLRLDFDAHKVSTSFDRDGLKEEIEQQVANQLATDRGRLLQEVKNSGSVLRTELGRDLDTVHKTLVDILGRGLIELETKVNYATQTADTAWKSGNTNSAQTERLLGDLRAELDKVRELAVELRKEVGSLEEKVKGSEATVTPTGPSPTDSTKTSESAPASVSGGYLTVPDLVSVCEPYGVFDWSTLTAGSMTTTATLLPTPAGTSQRENPAGVGSASRTLLADGDRSTGDSTWSYPTDWFWGTAYPDLCGDCEHELEDCQCGTLYCSDCYQDLPDCECDYLDEECEDCGFELEDCVCDEDGDYLEDDDEYELEDEFLDDDDDEELEDEEEGVPFGECPNCGYSNLDCDVHRGEGSCTC